jgi:hypothetical protein
LTKNTGNKKRRKQKGVEAIFSPTDESQKSPEASPITRGPKVKVTSPVRLFLLLQATFILFLLTWLIYASANDLSFKNRLYETVSYLPPVQLLVIGVAGLGLSIVWGIVNYRKDHGKLSVPVRQNPEEEMRGSLEIDSYGFT